MTANAAPLPAGNSARLDASLSENQISPSNFKFLQHFIHSQSGIIVQLDKRYLVEARLLPIVREQKLASLDGLATRLASGSAPSLGKLVVEAMTTNETLFFRDPLMFEALRREILPAMFKGGKRGRIWSAAASTGQEAYSIAMLLIDLGVNPSQVEILGTDISSQVLDRARTGRYGQFEVNRGVSSQMLARHFAPAGSEWQLKERVLRMVRFEQLDLRRDLSHIGTFDLVLCRNVLIYFDVETKKKILARIHAVLSPGAALVLGCAETVNGLHDVFARRTVGNSTFYTR